MLKAIKCKIKLNTIIKIIPTMFFLFYVFSMMIHTYTGEVKRKISNTRASFESFMKLSDELEAVLQQNFYDKNNYINLNGLTTRLLGINTLNERQRLANGYLGAFKGEKDISKPAESVIELDKFLEDREIEFLYLLAPCKEAMYDVCFFPGYDSGVVAEKNIDNMITALEIGGVDTLDMNAWFKDNGWGMEDVFFKTDHHWMPNAGLAAARCTMEILSDKDLVNYDEDLLREESYTIKTYEDWFLGSHGVRTGKCYAGVDDIDVYYPNFPVKYKYSHLTESSEWFYSDSVLQLEPLEERDYFNSSPYRVYLYANYPIQIIENADACNEKRVLINRDSFGMVWGYFMITQFKEVYLVDLRDYKDGTFAQLVEEVQPDIVIMCTNEGSLSRKKTIYNFGVKEYLSALEETSPDEPIVELGSLELEPEADNKNNFAVVCSNLEPNQTYTLTVDSTMLSGGEDLYVQMSLRNLLTDEAIYNRYFDGCSDEEQKWIFTTPDDDVDGTYAVYLYAGTKGHTKGVSVKVDGIKLQKGISED